MMKCPICHNNATLLPNPQKFDGKIIECPHCKKFTITNTLSSMDSFKNLSQKDKDKLSNYLKQFYEDFGAEFQLNSDNYKKIIDLPTDFNTLAQTNYKEKGITLDKSLYDFSQQFSNLKLTKDLELTFHELIKEVESRLSAEQRRTNALNVEVMQAIAYKINSDGPFIDLSVGFGGLIWKLKNLKFAQDIKSDVLDVAKLIAFQNNLSTNISRADSITDKLQIGRAHV